MSTPAYNTSLTGDAQPSFVAHRTKLEQSQMHIHTDRAVQQWDSYASDVDGKTSQSPTLEFLEDSPYLDSAIISGISPSLGSLSNSLGHEFLLGESAAEQLDQDRETKFTASSPRAVSSATLDLLDSMSSSEDEEDEGIPTPEAKLRAFACDAGLPEESRFLSHWFGLTKPNGAMEDKMPRPSAWNMFDNETKMEIAVEAKPKDVFGLRKFAVESGLPEESRFLSHWFGVAGTDSESLPRPSPWNRFAAEASFKIAAPKQEHSTNSYELRKFALEAGLPEESRFLGHWFGLASAGGTLEDKLPRPSPWNHFMTEKAIVEDEIESVPVNKDTLAMPTREAKLRAFACDAGLPEESRFLSHWFGLTKPNGAMEDKMPRPSAWNMFDNETKMEIAVEAKLKDAYGLRKWAMESGLPEESRFLSHWFGLAGCAAPLDDKLPRPSPWNRFVDGADKKTEIEDSDPACMDQQSGKKAFALRAFALESGLNEDSQFLAHWFGLKQSTKTAYTDAVGPAGTSNNGGAPWLYAN